MNSYTTVTSDGSSRQWQHSTALNPTVLEQLHELNRSYLELLVRKGREPDDYEHTLHVINLSPARRALLARCPFSLFTVRFGDSEFWTSHARKLVDTDVVREPVLPYPDSDDGMERSDPWCATFAKLALFYAWHLVQSNPLAARILLGMPEPTIHAFKRLPPAYLQRLAHEQPDLVGARWAQHTEFCQKLLRTVQLHGANRLEELHALGIQMIAASIL